MGPERLGRRAALALAFGGLIPTRWAEASRPAIQSSPGSPKRDPALSAEERKTLLLEVHKLIETAADQAVRRLTGREPVGVLTYPPGRRLTATEGEALTRWIAPPEARGAVRGVVADAIAGPVYDLLCMIDGAREPEGWEVPWRPFEITGAPEGSPPGTLHHAFHETYREWQRRRPDPGWSLEGEKGRP